MRDVSENGEMMRKGFWSVGARDDDDDENVNCNSEGKHDDDVYLPRQN